VGSQTKVTRRPSDAGASEPIGQKERLPVIPAATKQGDTDESTTAIIATVCKFSATLNSQSTEMNLSGEKVIAVVSLVGDLDVNIVLAMPSATAVGLASKFAGLQISFESSDMADAVGELANMVAGDLRIRLDKCHIKANISVPTVYRGQLREA